MVMATDIEIMERLQSRAVTCGERLTYTHKLFYMRLLYFAARQDSDTSCPEGLKVSLTVNEMASVLNITKRMVVQSLGILSDCGILLRYNGMTFPRSSVTIIKKEFYERSNT